MISLPLDFENRMKHLLGEDFSDYLAALEKTPSRAFRVNTDKISLERFGELCTFDCKKIPYSQNGYYFEHDKIGNHPYHHAGVIYVQEPSAMAPVECLDFDPDWYVLDMCAAPGGKSTQAKNKLGKKGVLVSNEVIPSRCKILTGNVERLGLKNTITTCLDVKKLCNVFENTFDLVIVDAPCSGEGMFRKDPNAITEWSADNIRICAERQYDILQNAVKALKKGGYIIYATCTFSLEENEMMIDRFLCDHPEFELVKANDKVIENTVDGIFFDGCKCENINYARRFMPHKNFGEGQFMAVLHNTLDKLENPSKKSKPKATIPPIVCDFLSEVLCDYDQNAVRMYNSKPVIFDGDIDVPDGAAFSFGVTVGEIKKNYILPHHQFFMAMGNHFKNKIELSLDDERLIKYLKGEEISVQCNNGWAAVLVDGCTLGGAKVVNNTAKNHYPKGLRLK